jgi:hypothetical protein
LGHFEKMKFVPANPGFVWNWRMNLWRRLRLSGCWQREIYNAKNRDIGFCSAGWNLFACAGAI